MNVLNRTLLVTLAIIIQNIILSTTVFCILQEVNMFIIILNFGSLVGMIFVLLNLNNPKYYVYASIWLVFSTALFIVSASLFVNSLCNLSVSSWVVAVYVASALLVAFQWGSIPSVMLRIYQAYLKSLEDQVDDSALN
jgi:hypothetical protein